MGEECQLVPEITLSAAVQKAERFPIFNVRRRNTRHSERILRRRKKTIGGDYSGSQGKNQDQT